MSNSNSIETVANIQQARRCYIAAPINTDLKAIEKLLVERQLQPIVSADLSSDAMTFLGGIVNAVATADLFVAVLSPEQNNDIVYLELGIAIASQRRILIITPPDRPLMVDIAELPAVRSSMTNHEAISLMLDQVLLAPPRKFSSQLIVPPTQKGQPIGDFADELLENLNALGEQVREIEMVFLVRDALEKSGYPPIVEASLGKGKRADLVVWSDEFGPWIGNPLIIELKSGLMRRNRLLSTIDQVSEYLQLSQTRSALVLYDNVATGIGISPSMSPPNIFFLDIHQLFTAMRTKSFAQVMIDLRNRRVHGIDTL